MVKPSKLRKADASMATTEKLYLEYRDFEALSSPPRGVLLEVLEVVSIDDAEVSL